jgi:hypothetical protein
MPAPGYTKRTNAKKGTKVIEGVVIGRGDNQTVIDPKEVEKLASLWCSINEMADYFNVPINTFKYNFIDVIKKGRAETRRTLRQAQIKVALSGNVTMLIWLGKNILGQSDAPEELESEPEMTREEIDARIQELLKTIKDDTRSETRTDDAVAVEGTEEQVQQDR